MLRVLLKYISKIVNKKTIFLNFNVNLKLLRCPFLVSGFLLFFISCDQFVVNKEEVIARVGAVYLYRTIDKAINTDITSQELDSFLLQNRSVFKLNAPLFQVRFIELPHDNVDINEIKRSFQRFDEEDKDYLDSLSFQFTNHILADSIWINKSNLLSEVSFLNQENLNTYIKKSQFFEIEDSLGVYLFFVKDYLKKDDYSPSEVLYPTIKNILLNQRKLQFNNQFEKDIIQDAIKSKTYEIY